jgi:uncharacterized protein YecT (DUF1311 family)
MTDAMRYATLLFCFFSLNAFAQYSGPAVQACIDYAKREQKAGGGSAQAVVFERDQSLQIERYTRKLGSQFVSSILTGNGAVVLEGAPSAELAFICLLENEKKPLFFEWLPRPFAPAAAQCLRSAELQKAPRACYELLHRIADQDLNAAYAQRFQEANQRGDAAVTAFRKSNDEWKQYADAECARRRGIAPSGVSPEDYALACYVDLIRRRAQDMK